MNIKFVVKESILYYIFLIYLYVILGLFEFIIQNIDDIEIYLKW